MNTPQDYIDQGWAIVPVLPGEKKARDRQWQKRDYTAADFGPDENVAVKCGKPSDWLVDVDLDCAEAVEAAKALLPRTPLVHGRPSKRISHYWFRCEEFKTTQFTDVGDESPTGRMLVEVRSTGGYTVVPPSLHPSGEALAWESEGDPFDMTPEDMYGAARNVALAALLARHWPGQGARHVVTGHLTGFLLHAGLDVADVVRVIRTAARIAGDPDLDDREKYVRSTFDKFKAGERITGGPKLAAEVGQPVVDKMRAWLKLADLDAIEEMNERHFVTRLKTKTVIGRHLLDGPLFQVPKDLFTEYDNRFVQVGADQQGNPRYAKLFKTWLESPLRRQFLGGVVNNPPPFDRDVTPDQFNLWTGFAVQPQAGDWPRLQAHLLDIICSGNQAHYDYLIKWYAFTVQFPGIVPKVAVITRGRPGTGKGTAVLPLEMIFGRKHFVQRSRSEELVKWNSLISGKVVVFADEAFFAGDRQNLGNLKRIISEDTITVARKHIDSDDERNCVHLIIATNEDWAVSAQKGERRFFALEVSDAKEQDVSYFSAIRRELANGGAAAFLDFLLRQPVTLADVLDVPKTSELRNQQDQSLDLHLAWWQECLMEGAIGQHPWAPFVPWKVMYEEYERFAEKRTKHLLTSGTFSQRMAFYFSTLGKQMKDRVNGSAPQRGWRLRDLADARQYFDSVMKTATEWPDDPSQQGLWP